MSAAAEAFVRKTLQILGDRVVELAAERDELRRERDELRTIIESAGRVLAWKERHEVL